MIPASTMYLLVLGDSARGSASYCSLGAEAHHVLDAGAVVPAAVEDHDLARGREVLDVALHVHLRLLAVRGRGQRHEAEDARADALGDGLDRAALAGRVAALEDDDDAQALVLDPLLQVHSSAWSLRSSFSYCFRLQLVGAFIIGTPGRLRFLRDGFVGPGSGFRSCRVACFDDS